MYPESEDKKINLLSSMICSYLEKEGVQFCIEGADLYPQEVAGHFGCLPLFLLEAKETYDKIFSQNFSVAELGSSFARALALIEEQNFSAPAKELAQKPFPVNFLDEKEAYFNAVPEFVQTGVPFVFLAHFTHYSVEEYIQYYLKNDSLMQNGKIPLDALFAKWKDAVLKNKISIKEKAQPSPKTGETKKS